MNINATLFAQAIVFAILVWFTMKFVWPPIAKALDERAQKISEGLAASEKAKTELAVANKRVEEELSKSRNESATRLADAERRAHPARRSQHQHGFARLQGASVDQGVVRGGVSHDERCREPQRVLRPAAELTDHPPQPRGNRP